jgi:predicted RNA-binding protein with PUA-like domain
MACWLLKSEPSAFSIDDLKARPRRTEHWDGVRNYQARNHIRQMRAGDRAFFYHSSCAEPGVVGIVRIVSEPYPDFTAFDPKAAHYDPKSDPARPRWYMVDVRHERSFRRTITLAELKARRELADMALVQRGSRLSVMPVTERQWQCIIALEGAREGG